MRTTLNLSITIEHNDNLLGDVRTITADVAEGIYDNFVTNSGSSRVHATPDGRGTFVEYAGNRVLAYIKSAAIESRTQEVVE